MANVRMEYSAGVARGGETKCVLCAVGAIFWFRM